MVDIERKYGFITFAPGAMDALKEKTLEILKPLFCDDEKPAPDKMHPCIEPAEVINEFDRVFADGRLDYIEAPGYYYFTNFMAGEDLYLEVNETEMLISDITLGLKKRQNRPTKKDKEDTPTPVEEPMSRLPALIRNWKALTFEQDKTRQQEVIEELDGVITTLKGTISRYEVLWKYFIAYEKAPWRSWGPSNWFGLLSLFSADDEQQCNLWECQGVYTLIAEYRQLETGAEKLRSQLESGHHDFKNYMVRKFLASPFASAVNFRRHFSKNGGGPS